MSSLYDSLIMVCSLKHLLNTLSHLSGEGVLLHQCPSRRGYLKTPQKQGKSFPEGNGPVPHHDEFGSREPTMADVYRMFEELDRMDKSLDMISELTGMLRTANKRLAGLENKARQPRLATEADVERDTKTRKRTEEAAADRAKHGDKSSSFRVDHDPMRLPSFGGDSTELPAPEKSIGDALVDKGAEAPKPYILPMEMRTLTTAGGLLPTSTTSTATRMIFSRPCPS